MKTFLSTNKKRLLKLFLRMQDGRKLSDWRVLWHRNWRMRR